MAKNDEGFFTQSLQEDLENLERYIQEYSLFLPLAVFSINPMGVIVDVNQAGKDITKYEETELIGRGVDFLFSQKKSIDNLFKKTLEKGGVKNKELDLVNKDGKKMPVRVSSSARKDQDDNVIGSFIAVSDITEIKKFQEKLEEKVRDRTKELEETKDKLAKTLEETKDAKEKVENEKNKTMAIISNLVDPIIILDQESKILLFNPEAKEIFGLGQSSLGKKINKKNNYSLENFKKVIKKDYTVTSGEELESRNSDEEEVEIEHQGDNLTYRVVTTKVYDNKNKFIGTMKIFSDLTREKRINRLKTEFVSIAAHQLRTPLSAIKWAIKMILDGDTGKINEDQRDLLKKGFESNERMIKLVNDMLNVSRIEEGRLEYNFEKENFKETYKTVVGSLKNKIKEKNVNFDIKEPQKIPYVYIDREKIRLVLQNLLENAVKYTPENGKITLEIKKNKKNLVIRIKDNGVGIPKKDQEKLFSKFFRAENVIKMQTDGNGLGLFIAKNVVKKHGGDIECNSEEGRGTEFIIHLPLNNKKEDK